jgi:hypothetical protein
VTPKHQNNNTMKYSTLPWRALACACALTLAASHARASTLIDTQAPAGGLTNSPTVDTSSWLAERFTLAQATTVSSISAFLLSSDEGNDIGKSLTLAVYADTSRGAETSIPDLDWFADQQGQLFQTGLTFNGNGWSSASNLNWSLASGKYWFALETDGSGVSGLQVPTGTPQFADKVAFYSGGTGYSTNGMSPSSDTFGLRVSAVPEPTSIPLALAGMSVMALLLRRRQA